MDDPLEPLIDHLTNHTALPSRQLRHLVDEVFAYCAETVEQYVARRHRQLAAEGHRNEHIYQLLQAEVCNRPFAAPPPSRRQIRRMIYG